MTRATLFAGACSSRSASATWRRTPRGATCRPNGWAPPTSAWRSGRATGSSSGAGTSPRANGGAAVISFPGRKGTQLPARMLARHGCGVLVFDRRGEGDSEGDANSFGWGGDADILAAAAFLRSRPEVEPGRIGGLGLSVGGELMLQVAAQHPDVLAGVVSEGAGTRTLSEDVDASHGVEKVIGFPFLVTKTAAVAVFSNTSPPPKLLDLLPRIERPVLLIHNGRRGEELNHDYHRAVRAPKREWLIPEAPHIGGATARPAEYERRIAGFLGAALLGRGSR